MTLILLLLAGPMTTYLYSQSDSPVQFRIFNAEFRQISDISELLKEIEEFKTVIIGEEHDNATARIFQKEFIQNVSDKYKIAIGLEFLERDCQLIADEYLADLIQEDYIKKCFASTNQYEKGFADIVRFAKSRKLALVATNAPRRYVNLVSRKGLPLLKTISPNAEKYIAPFADIKTNIAPGYQEKLSGILSEVHGNMKKENLIDAQFVWDATMADSIQKYIKKKTKDQNTEKFIHINGRVHSDNGLGLTYRLKKKGMKVLTIAIIREKEFADLEKKPGKENRIADILVVTN